MSSPLVGRAWSDGSDQVADAIGRGVIRRFNDLPLPVRMRACVEVMKEADERYGASHSWSPDGMLVVLDKWEQQDARDAGKEKLMEELAEFIRSADWDRPDVPLGIARKLIDAGWTKKATGDE